MRLPSLPRLGAGKLAIQALAAALAATFATPAAAQLDPRRGPPGCVPVAERQMERGCYIMLEHRLGPLPTDVPLHWNIAAYPSRAAAEAARGPRGAVVEALGRLWLMSIAEAGYRPAEGEHLAEIGPLRIEASTPYTAAYMQGIMLPGAETGVHHHPGPEVILTLAGEECMETPASRMVGRPGGAPVVVPPGVPHRLTVTGTEERQALALVLHDSNRPWAIRTHEHGWTPRGLCRGD